MDDLGPTNGDGEVHVAVLGAGMAGLAAAAAASHVADRVTVLDRDPLPEGPVVRRGTPQARHIHALLAGGRRALDQLLPGFDVALADAGAREVDNGGGFGFRGSDGWIRPVEDLTLRCVTRPAVEATVRRLVRQRDNVAFVGGWRVDGLGRDATGRVTSVDGACNGREATLSADLVVDATGRGSAGPTWLADLGLTAPDETVIDPRLWYATAVGHGSADLPAGMHAMLVTPTADDPRGGGMVCAEDGTFTISLTGDPGHPPPRTTDDFRRYAARLRTPAIARAIAPLRLGDEIAHIRSTANRARHYHRVEVPAGLVLIGDSVCALDPVYGQGMTVAAVQAVRLRTLLGELGVGHPSLTARFQTQAWQVARLAWDQATAADLELPSTDRTVALPARIMGGYARRVMRLCTIDASVARRVGRVMHLLDPPTHMLHPAIVGHVVADLVRRRPVPAHPADRPDTSALGLAGEAEEVA